MKNQQQLWNDLHAKRRLERFSSAATSFANEVAKIIRPESKILELGCGMGNDSSFFATQDHTVICTDFSEVVIRENREKYKSIPELNFQMLDTGKTPYPFDDEEFDVVYARLSLHYFTNQITHNIVDEIYRILKRSGYFCFMCKSTQDPEYGKGEEIEENMFELNGHVRHFFTESYVREVLGTRFKIEKMESKKEALYGKENSAYIKVVARK